MFRKKAFWIVLTVLALVAGGGYAAYAAGLVGWLAPQESVLESTLQTATVAVGDISITADGTGMLVASSEVNLAFGSSGTLMELLVEVGDEVQAGEVLARIDDTDARRAVLDSQLSVLQAQETCENAQDTGALEQAVAQAELNVAQAEADLEAAKSDLEGLVGWAPDETDVEIAQANLSIAQADYRVAVAKANMRDDETTSVRVNLDQAIRDLEEAQANYANALGANLILVMPSMARGGFGAGSEPPSLTYDDLPVIAENVTGVSGVSAEQNTTQDVKAGSVTLESVSIVGTTVGFTAVREYSVAEGRFLTDEDNDRTSKVAVLGYDLALELFGEPAAAVGQSIKVDSTKLAVVGVMEPKGVVGSTDYDSRVYVPITLVFDKFTSSRFGSDRVRVVYVSAQSKETMEGAMSQLNELLMQIFETTPESPGFTLTTQDSIIDTQASTTETFRNLLGWVAGVSLMVGGIGIMNIMLVSVTERTREIGLRQALGARPRDVQLQFLFEAVMLSLLGGLLGVLLGAGGSYLFDALGTMRTELVMSSIPLAFGAAAAVGIFFGYYPATKAAQLDPIVALRHE